MTSLYDPIVLGDMKLSNRVFMAPLTRNRATPNGVPNSMAVGQGRSWPAEYGCSGQDL
jgi:N-ethylmaleimide reductase